LTSELIIGKAIRLLCFIFSIEQKNRLDLCHFQSSTTHDNHDTHHGSSKLKTMRGRQIRFMGGTYGGEHKKGSGCGWLDNTATISPKKMWVIVDMTGQGKQLKHTQVSHSSFRYCDWFNVQVLTFEEHLLQQYPEIEDPMEQLARLLAWVKGLDKKMKGSDSSLMPTF
jgi:hypothetical protein